MKRYNKEETLKVFLKQNKAQILYDGQYHIIFEDGTKMITTNTSDEIFGFLLGYKFASVNYEKILERTNEQHNLLIEEYKNQLTSYPEEGKV